jgi:hypothetical protein
MPETDDSDARDYVSGSGHLSKWLSFQHVARPAAKWRWRVDCMYGVLRIRQEEHMNRLEIGFASSGIAVLAIVLGLGVVAKAQEPPAPQTEQRQQVADGQRRGLPIETYAVAPGTKFLVKLEDELGTRGTQENAKFKVKTLEPLEAGSGIYLPVGAEIRGHISHVEPAGVAGRAKLWLTFDEIHTKFGVLPIVAEVVSVPGDHSVRSGPRKEGLIEGRSSTQQDAAESAAAGAAIGAVKGVKNKDKKEAAEGAALGALTAYLMESGRGHELNLPKGAKLELELERALYLLKE